MKRALFIELLGARERKRPVALVTELTNGRQTLVDRNSALGDLTLKAEQIAMVHEAIAANRSGKLEGTDIFVHVINPPLRMIVVGAVHIAQVLVPMAALAGYEVILIDPRGAWATEARFPGVSVSTDWPDDALRSLKPDRRTAIVALTHDPKLDDPALTLALRSEAFYIGALGSKRTHAKRLSRLSEHGFTIRDFGRIHGPIGLDIGAKSPAEIAIAVLAEVTRVLHGPPASVRREAAE